jgi:hypothetical protein
MRTLKRLVLSAVTATTGVLVACAYGMFYSWTGRVRDATTQQGIPGIRVSCLVGGSVVDTGTTDGQGSYDLDRSGDCEQLRFEDVDGAANGTYDGTTVDLPQESGLVVDLTPAP